MPMSPRSRIPPLPIFAHSKFPSQARKTLMHSALSCLPSPSLGLRSAPMALNRTMGDMGRTTSPPPPKRLNIRSMFGAASSTVKVIVPSRRLRKPPTAPELPSLPAKEPRMSFMLPLYPQALPAQASRDEPVDRRRRLRGLKSTSRGLAMSVRLLQRPKSRPRMRLMPSHRRAARPKLPKPRCESARCRTRYQTRPPTWIPQRLVLRRRRSRRRRSNCR